MVNEVFVSRHHAELRPEGGATYVLHPTGSTPTIFNDVPLAEPQALREGDTFNVGTMRFVFTQKRLPVAMAIAEPSTNVLSGVDDRRPTLTFPLPGVTQPETVGRPTTVWIVLAAVLVIVAAAIYFLG
jgi:pSer/pThr/pTyr-binding forkhead associated (FHA) protein